MIQDLSDMFELPVNDKSRQDAGLVASYVLELLHKGKDMYKLNHSIVVYTDGRLEFLTDKPLYKEVEHVIYPITAEVFDIVKREVADKGWHLVKINWSCPTGLNWSYRLISNLSRDDVDNPAKTIVV